MAELAFGVSIQPELGLLGRDEPFDVWDQAEFTLAKESRNGPLATAVKILDTRYRNYQREYKRRTAKRPPPYATPLGLVL